MSSSPTTAAFVAALATTVLLPASRVHAWDAEIAGSGPGRGVARAVATATSGDVIAAGSIPKPPDGTRFAVVRLDGATGAERWRTVLPGSGPIPTFESEGATAVTVDHAGDVVAAGQLVPQPFDSATLTLVKLDGDTGTVLWRFDQIRTENPRMVVDEANDVYVSATVHWPSRAYTVTKLLGTTGAVQWMYGHAGFARDIGLLSNQDVVATGAFDGGVPAFAYITPQPPTGVVQRLDRTTGYPVWTSTFSGGQTGTPTRLVVTPRDDVFVSGFQGLTVISTLDPKGLIAAVNGDTGTVRWTRELAAFDTVDAIATTSGGDLALLGASGAEYVGGATDLHAYVLGSAGGAIVADRVIPPAPCVGCTTDGVATAIVADPSGDLFAVGSFRFFELAAARLAGADLDVVWRRDGGPSLALPGFFTPEAAARGTDGRLLVAGSRQSIDASDPFTVLAFDADGGALHGCGDGVVDSGEACDDGYRDAGDCCAADCTTAAPDGTACDDASVCTLADRCIGGRCTPASLLPCEPCGQCDPGAGCYIGPRPACGRSTITKGAALEITAPRRGTPRFEWSLRSGPATSKAALGNPLDSTRYAVCGSLPNGRVVLRATTSDRTCSRRRRGSCWRSTRGGFEYVDPSGSDGLTRLSLHAAAAGKTRFRATGAKRALTVPALPITGELRIELRRLDDPATCWSSTLATVTKNGAQRFRATGN